MKTLLLLTDFSDNGNHAAEYGYHLARQLKANVVLCNAIVIPAQIAEAGVIGWPVNGYDGLIEASDEELKKLKKHFEHTDHSSGFHPEISCLNQMGRLAEVVDNIINICYADMVVMGTHHKVMGDFLLENNSKRVISSTSCPLLLVPPQASFADIDKIAFATDLEYPEQDLANICGLLPMVRTLGAEIVVTHVNSAGQLTEDRQRIGNELVTGVRNKGSYQHILYKTVQNDHPQAGLSLFCENEQINLLVMIHRPHNFIDVLLKGSHTQKMAAHLIIPLLVLPDKALSAGDD